MNRRQFLFAGAGVLTSSVLVRAQTDRVAVLAAGRTNVVALRTGDAMVLVDSGVPELAGALTSSLPERVATVFNTHWHLENTGANEALRNAGAEIVAHEQTRVWMSTPTWLPAEDRYRQPRPKNAQPTKTF